MDIEKDSNCKLFVVNEESIKYFNRILDGCKDSFSYYKLGEEIASFNEALYDSAVREVALSSNPISLLVDEVEVEQFRKISDTHRAITLRKRNAKVSWSSVIQFIRTNNKDKENPQIPCPFTNIDYLILNAYGANLIKIPIPKTYEYSLRKLAGLNRELNCFFSNSNTSLKKQLSIIFDMISEKRNEAAGEVKAIERHSKLIYMEFMKYSSLINNLSVVDVDRLIDLIIRQYTYSLNRSRTSTTSKMF